MQRKTEKEYIWVWFISRTEIYQRAYRKSKSEIIVLDMTSHCSWWWRWWWWIQDFLALNQTTDTALIMQHFCVCSFSFVSESFQRNKTACRLPRQRWLWWHCAVCYCCPLQLRQYERKPNDQSSRCVLNWQLCISAFKERYYGYLIKELFSLFWQCRPFGS